MVSLQGTTRLVEVIAPDAPVAVPDKLPVTVPTCDCVPTVPVCAVPCCAVPVAPVIVDAVKFVGAAAAVEVKAVGAVIDEPVIVVAATSVGATCTLPPNNSFDCTPCCV